MALEDGLKDQSVEGDVEDDEEGGLRRKRRRRGGTEALLDSDWLGATEGSLSYA